MFTQPGVAPIRAARILAATLMSALVVIGTAMTVVLSNGPKYTGSVSAWNYLFLGVLGVGAATAVQTFGYRTPALTPQLDAAEARGMALMAFQRSMMLRFALSESVAIVSIALSYSVHPTSITIYLLGGAISLALMAIHVWPSDRVIDRVQQSLDRAGGRSELAAALRGQSS